VVLDDFVPADHMCRAIDAFVATLVMSDLDFERAPGAETGRLGYPSRPSKCRILGPPRLLMRGLAGARAEIGIAATACSLKRILNVLGATKLTEALRNA
jgi:hypothetical protein